jgi:hypothetical protein
MESKRIIWAGHVDEGCTQDIGGRYSRKETTMETKT